MAMANATSMLASFSRLAVSPRCFSDASTSGTSGVSSNTSSHTRLVGQARENAAAASVSWSSDSVPATAAVISPALQFANLMWFKGAYNAQVFCGEDESADSVVRRFRKAVMQAGVIPECRRRRFFETPQDIVKRKQAARRKKPKRGNFVPREGYGDDATKAGSKANDDDGDFWGFAEEGADVNF